MSESTSSYNKIDFLIIIILALLIAFIVVINVINIGNCDNKKSNINNENLEQPQMSINPNIRQINHNNQTISESALNMSQIGRSEIGRSELAKSQASDLEINSQSLEHFGNINPHPHYYGNEIYQPYSKSLSNVIGGLISEKTAEELIAQPSLYDTLQNPNFNNLNNIPVLISPDPPGPNSVPASAPSYYNNRVKLIDNPDSKLLQLYEQNYKNLEKRADSCNLRSRQAPPMVNGTFDGYNAYENLAYDSYSNVTAIGKGMLTPYTSFPVPS